MTLLGIIDGRIPPTANPQHFGTIPDTLEDVWVATALGEVEEARPRISEVPSRHPFDLRYAQDLPQNAWERCAEVLDHYDVLRVMKQPW